MVGDSKILTVSYGTFSCTLEGFDDPFTTMQAIAEYFRDLAAGDRYFGAEPPQPDSEMLQRIAEQTNRSRVDAQMYDNALVLRQTETDTPEQAPVASPAAAMAATAAAVAQDVAADDEADADVESQLEETPLDVAAKTDTAEDMTQEADDPARDPAEAISEHAGYGQRDSIAEKLQRIRAVVSRENAPSNDEAAFFNEDEHADTFAASAPETATYEAEYGAAYEDETDHSTASIGSSMLASVMARAADDVDADASDTEEADTLEDKAEEEMAADEDDSALTDALAALSAEDEAQDETAFEAEAEADLEPEIDVEAELSSEASALAEAHIEEDAAAVDMDDEMDPKPATSVRQPIKVEKISRSDIEAAQTGSIEFEGTPDASSNGSELSAEAEAALMNELAQVEAEMQATSENATDRALEEVDSDDMDAEDVDAQDVDAKDINSDEFAIQLEPTEEQSHRDEELDAAVRAARKQRALQVEDEDDALNRLMDATSSRMSDDDEGALRRASIAHLKAAVAATKADDSIAQAAADEDEREMDQYRSDLARVVRPGRAQPRAEEDEARRASPLVLVSEQRIVGEEEEQEAVAAKMQPRRINAGTVTLEEEFEEEVGPIPFASEDQESFSAFAARHSAVELPDLLEAAAAHYAYVEQKDDFTRPMLMNKTIGINDDGSITREDGLRAFGSLLRRGRIVKRGNGKFVISETSQFAPEAREAGE